MRSLKKIKPKNPTILQQQSNKLKQKLQLLKQQVTLKKQEKQMSKTASSLNGHKNDNWNAGKQINSKMLMATTKINRQQTVDIRFKNALLQMKIENIEPKLKQKGVKEYQKLLQLTDEEIDQWKDILVGYRIKMKKYIKINHKKQGNSNSQFKTNLSGMQSRQQCKQINKEEKNSLQHQRKIETENDHLQKQKNIEQIIKERQKIKIFIPLMRQCEQIQEQFDHKQREYITEEDQDIIIESFMKVFHPRKPILKLNNCKNISPQQLVNLNTKKNVQKNQFKHKNVHWSPQVVRMQKQFERKNHKKYPKQAIKKQALINFKLGTQTNQTDLYSQQKAVNQIKYCWKCFRKIDLKANIGFKTIKQAETIQYFCSQKCQNSYNQELVNFIKIVPFAQEQTCNIDENCGWQDKNQKLCYQEQQDMECIDLTIL